MPAKPRLHSAEDDLAFMRSIVEGGGRPLGVHRRRLAGV
jgi:hypothetical protein